MPAGTAIANISALTDNDLAAIASYEDALAVLVAAGVAGETMAEYGTGFKVTDKAKLVGIDLILLQWRFNDGDYEGGFVSVEAVTKHGEKVIFNDGSTGVYSQLLNVTKLREERGHKHPQAGLGVEGGLTATSYWYNADTKETRSKLPEGGGKGWTPASTYYLAG